MVTEERAGRRPTGRVLVDDDRQSAAGAGDVHVFNIGGEPAPANAPIGVVILGGHEDAGRVVVTA